MLRKYEREHPEPYEAAENYVLSNPLSGGELVLVGITGLIGYGLADFVGRYMETTPIATGLAANSIPAGQTVGNDVATTAFPSWQAMAAQFAVAAVPGVAAAFVDSPWGRAALQGMMLGAGFSLFGGLFKSLMASMIGSTALGQQLYLAEVEAQAAVTAAGGSTSAATTTTTAAPTATTTGVTGLPRGVGARPPLRSPAPGPQGVGQSQPPFTLAPSLANMASGFSPGGPGNPAPPLATPGGAPVSAIPQPAIPVGYPPRQMPQPPGILTNTGDVLSTAPNGTPTPGGPSTGPMCAPCTSTSGGIAATHEAADAAIRDDSCLGALPVGFGMYHSFPEEAAA
jgi:hypothetical protein